MINPLVSVIIPCYNQGRFILETIDSVLNQTYQNFEVILINDGSTDELTNDIFCRLEDYHPKLRIISKKNSGVCDSRNLGINSSIGEYILPLDGDDLLAPSYIEKAVSILDNMPKIKVVTCEVEYFGFKKGKFILPEYSLEGLMGQNLIVCTSMFRKIDFDEAGGYNENMRDGFEDWDFWLSMLKDGGQVFRINEVLFFYRINKRSRNRAINQDLQLKLRKQIYINHIELFSTRFFNPQLSFEYLNLLNSKEYKFGKLLLKPIRKVMDKFSL